MPISSTTTNYTGRKKDISVLQNPDALNSDPQDVSLSFGKSGKFCAGVQKLVQRYVILLLTNIGSQKYYPDFGTELLYNLKAGVSPVDLIGVTQMFSLASFEAVNALLVAQIQDPTSPSDERIASAELEDISMISSAVNFSVRITTESETAISFVVPLPI